MPPTFRVDNEQAPAEYGDLGAVVATQTATHAIAWVIIGLGLVLMLASALIVFAKPPGNRPPPVGALVVGCITGVIAIHLFSYGVQKRWIDRDFALWLHENGVRERRNRRETSILFDDADEVNLATTRIFVNGVYSGTVEHLGLRQGNRSAYFRRKRIEPDPRAELVEVSEITCFVNRAAAAVAARFVARLLRGELVAWTPQFRLTAQALHIAPVPWWRRDLRDMFRHQKWQHVEWKDVDKGTIEEGVFRLWLRGEPRPRVSLATSLPNFHPGLLVFDALVKRAKVA